jgi:YHS domain-containing protein
LRSRAAALLAAACLSACGTMFYTPDGADSSLMLHGYDPVAYFAAGQATPGRAELKADHRGYIYRFASDESRRQFITNPDRYVPQFGGFSAQGMVYAIPVAGDSRTFKIIDDRLYLFDSPRARLYFEMDQERNLKLALHYWETEVRDAPNWQLQALKRLFFHVPHFRTNAELAEEYEKRFGRKPG